MKVTKLKIDTFRHIENQTIEFGDKLTVITGQNGTGKSSLLGWVAQACDFKSSNKTITGKSFQSKYSEIFRFCQENDYSEKYAVSLCYKEAENRREEEKVMNTRYEKTEKRYRVDFDGRGTALDFPVIYLGLKRLIPLATEKSISQKAIQLNKEELSTFSRLSKKILILLDDKITSEGIKSTNKDILAMKTSRYSHLGNSAGQDNMGQIISALLSFKRLEQERKGDYQGGLLLIDEIDATLYAGSQIHLVEELYNFSRKHNIQVVFTTHSLEILEHLSERVGEDTKINFLELKNKTIINRLNPPIKFLINKVKVQTGQKNKVQKLEVICEDREAELWCRNLLNGVSYKNNLNIKAGPFGEGFLSKMAESRHPIFKDVYFVLDGDRREKYKNKKLPPRTILLPERRPPEVVFYDFVNNLNDNDPFWIENEDFNYSKQTVFQNYSNDELSTVKKWFKSKEFQTLFGTNYAKLFNRWKKDNQEAVREFQNHFREILNG